MIRIIKFQHDSLFQKYSRGKHENSYKDIVISLKYYIKKSTIDDL